jgi:superfamily II DNA or RNA helicase
MEPKRFGTLVLDEAHHAVAGTWKTVIEHFGGHAKILGATATPDRSDEAALGEIFETVAYRYDIVDGIRDGWLVPIRQSVVDVEGLDYSEIRTTAGDLNGGDLARVLEYEANLHRMMRPTLEIAGDRRTLVFAATVEQARRLAEIANRVRPDTAASVDGLTPLDRRAEIFRRFSSGELQVLVNVGIATEGWDDAAADGRGVQVIAMMRPTKSRALYTQMCGRGLRPLPGVVDAIEDADGRRESIHASRKDGVLILDFVGNAGRHRLMTAADALGGRYDDRTRDAVRDRVSNAGEGDEIDILEELDEQDRLIRAEEEAHRRRKIVARASFTTNEIDPFAFVGIVAPKVSASARMQPLSPKQRAFLLRNGIANVDRLCKKEASAIIERILGKPSEAQAWVLRKHGYDPSQFNRREASQIIDQIKTGGSSASLAVAGQA